MVSHDLHARHHVNMSTRSNCSKLDPYILDKDRYSEHASGEVAEAAQYTECYRCMQFSVGATLSEQKLLFKRQITGMAAWPEQHV